VAAELVAKGVVLSTNPLTTVTADLVNHEVVLTIRLPWVNNYTPDIMTVRIGGQKLLDLIRFAQLAVEKPAPLYTDGAETCWRCGFAYMPHDYDYCPFCFHVDHCDSCSAYLHA
jgi:hypothetical protein